MRFRETIYLQGLIIVFILTFFSSPSIAEIPDVISFQGKVTDTGGTPVADGVYAMRFSIFDAVSGGNQEWYSGNVSVQVTGGIFDIILGESPQPAINLPFDEDYWLNVWIEGDTQSPRQPIASVGYSHMASGLVPGTEVNGSVTTGTLAAMKGTNTSTSGTAYGLYGEVVSTSGRGVYGYATSNIGSTSGVYGRSASNSGRGVFGSATATTGQAYGVLGQTNSTTGRGVYGIASATTGVNYGIYGRTMSPSGYAGYFEGDAQVSGDLNVGGTLTASGLGDITAVNAGTGLDGGGSSGDVTLNVEVPLSLTGNDANNGIIEGANSSTAGFGVWGKATATTGDAVGVLGTTDSSMGFAVYGNSTASTGVNYGVYGLCRSSEAAAVYGRNYCLIGGTGIYAEATADSGFSYGVYARSYSPHGKGISGENVATRGTGYGIYGSTSSTDGQAIAGYAIASSGQNIGILGSTNSTDGYSGWFNGRFYVHASINDPEDNPENHVVQFYNFTTGGYSDVLSLKIGSASNPSSGHNFITFFRSSDVAVGSIEGDGGGGITLNSGGADFAEFLPRLNPGESLESGDVVGVFEGKVTRRTAGASQCMAVSTRPIVLGNNPGNQHEDDYARIAFIGQVDVKVRGEVDAGDLLIPSGLEDGTAVAVSREMISPVQCAQIIGQAWEGSMESGIKKIRASVGLRHPDPSVKHMTHTIEELRAELTALRARLEELEAAD